MHADISTAKHALCSSPPRPRSSTSKLGSFPPWPDGVSSMAAKQDVVVPEWRHWLLDDASDISSTHSKLIPTKASCVLELVSTIFKLDALLHNFARNKSAQIKLDSWQRGAIEHRRTIMSELPGLITLDLEASSGTSILSKCRFTQVTNRPLGYDIAVHFLFGCPCKIQVFASRMPKFSSWESIFGLKMTEPGGDIMISPKVLSSKLLQIHRRYVVENKEPTCVGNDASADDTTSSTTKSELTRSTSLNGRKRSAVDIGGTSSRLIKEDSDDSGSSLVKRQRTRSSENSAQGRMFACPYYKYNPSEYGTQRMCAGPGWEQIHRLKYSPCLDIQILVAISLTYKSHI